MYELMTLYGYNFNKLSQSSSISGATSDVIQKVYVTLQYLQARGRAKTIDNSPLGIYSSINECNQTYIWGLSFNNGEMKKILKANGSKLRLIAGF